MWMRLGRIQASHPQVSDLHEMAVKDSKEGARLVWRQKPEQQQWLEAREGARADGVSRLCPAGDLEASAETSWFGILTRESTEAALRVIQRGHRPANDRRPRDLVATH